VKNFIRRAEFFQIMSVMETGAEQGMWTFSRYRAWMANRRDWHVPGREAAAEMISEENMAVRPALAPARSHAPAAPLDTTKARNRF